MFIALQNSIINIEEIRNASINSSAYRTLWIYFRNPSSPSDHLSLSYDNDKNLKKDFKILVEACEKYNNNKIKN